MPCAGNAESQLNGFPLRLEYVLSVGKMKGRAEIVMVINEGTDAAAKDSYAAYAAVKAAHSAISAARSAISVADAAVDAAAEQEWQTTRLI